MASCSSVLTAANAESLWLVTQRRATATAATRSLVGVGRCLPLPLSYPLTPSPLVVAGGATAATVIRGVRRVGDGERVAYHRDSLALDTRVRLWGRDGSQSAFWLAPVLRTVALLLGFAVVGGLTTTTAPTSSSTSPTHSSRGRSNFGNALLSATTATPSMTLTSSCEDGAGGGDSPKDDNDDDENEKIQAFPEDCIQHDNYDGLTLHVHRLPERFTASPQVFEETLGHSLNEWKQQERRGIWIHLTTEFSYLIPICTGKFGFEFQFAERGRVVLTRWLPKDSESRLPLGPTHQVGIGALVLHPSDPTQMLVVQEKTGPAASFGLWKMPTGLSDPGEDIGDAAVRELQEETGLDGVFDRIVCFRQAHGGMFNRSDLFFVCRLRLHERYLACHGEIPLQPCETEIADIRWMKMEDYANQDLWKNSPVYQEMNHAMIRAARSGDNADGFVGQELPVGFRRGNNTIYTSRNSSKL